MATADQIERILLEIDTSGADKAYIGVKRLDDVLNTLETRKGPTSAGDAIEKLGQSAKNAARDMASWDKKHSRNGAIEATRKDAHALRDAVVEASRIPTALQQAPKALTNAQRAFQVFARVAGPRATQGLVSTVGALEKIGPVVSRIGPPMASAAMAVGAVGFALAGGALYAAKEFGGAVIQAQTFKEDMVSALDVIDKGGKTTQDIMDQAARTSDFIGQSRAKTLDQFVTLIGKGFSSTLAENVITGMADIKVKTPKADVERMVGIMAQIQDKGVLANEELKQLREASFDVSGGLDAMAKEAGVSVDDMEKHINKGTIKSADAIEALLKGSNKSLGGKASGKLASDKSLTDMSSLMQRFEDIPSNVFMDVKVGPGMASVKDQLRGIVLYFDAGSESGKRVRQVVGDVFNAIVKGLTGSGIDPKKGITGVLDSIVTGAEKAIPTIERVAAGAAAIGNAFLSVADAAVWVVSLSKYVGGLGNALMLASAPARYLMAPFTMGITLLPEFAMGIGAIIDKVKSFKGMSFTDILKSFSLSGSSMFFGLDVAAGDALAGLGKTVSDSLAKLPQSLASSAASLYESATTLGTNLWQGVVQGINAGIGAVGDAARSMANQALAAVGVTWRVGSPARAFEDQALWAGSGLERGFVRSEPSVTSAASSMASAALLAASPKAANMNGGIRMMMQGESSSSPFRGSTAAMGAAAMGAPANDWQAASGSPQAQAGANPYAPIIAPSPAPAASTTNVYNFEANIVVPGASSIAEAEAIGGAAVRGARAEWEAQFGESLRRLRYG